MTSNKATGQERGSWKQVTASKMSRNTHNPIRNIVDNMKISPNPDKKMIALSIGDPTTFGNLPVCEEIIRAVESSLRNQLRSGYGPAIGYEDSREAVAKHHSTPTNTYEARDVILTCGCSGALDLCISVLADPGNNILFPCPGFSLYQVLAQSLGIEYKYYNLIPEKGWEVDLDHLESLIDSKTTCIVINNPSNPCGSVWKKDHMLDILSLAEKYQLPIIADEVYADFVFENETFVSFASLSKSVPILTCGGLTKKYLVPGWRFGWILIHDSLNVFEYQVRKGLTSLSQRILGPTSFIQGALKSIFSSTPCGYFEKSIKTCQTNAQNMFKTLSKLKGLKPIMPSGAMYMMVGLDLSCFKNINSDVEFTQQLIEQQSLFCLPASCFQYPNYFRIVLTVPENIMLEACGRIDEFCKMNTHREPDGPSKENLGKLRSKGESPQVLINNFPAEEKERNFKTLKQKNACYKETKGAPLSEP